MRWWHALSGKRVFRKRTFGELKVGSELARPGVNTERREPLLPALLFAPFLGEIAVSGDTPPSATFAERAENRPTVPVWRPSPQISAKTL
jgi:hypothetical protein